MFSLNYAIIATIIFFNLLGFFSNFEVLVYNEEVIIVICFVLFLSFAYRTIGASFASELDDRSTKIRDELAKSTSSWKNSERDVLFSWALVIFASNQTCDFFNWSKTEATKIAQLTTVSASKTLVSAFSQQLNALLLNEASFRSSTQLQMVSIFFRSINEFDTWTGCFMGQPMSSGLASIYGKFRASYDILINDSISQLANVQQIQRSSLSIASNILRSETLIAKLCSRA